MRTHDGSLSLVCTRERLLKILRSPDSPKCSTSIRTSPRSENAPLVIPQAWHRPLPVVRSGPASVRVAHRCLPAYSLSYFRVVVTNPSAVNVRSALGRAAAWVVGLLSRRTDVRAAYADPAAVTLSSGNTTLVVIVGAIAVFAVAIAMVFRRQVLAANDGTESMKTIAVAVQEGASAYLNRQFRTLSVFAVVVFLLLFLLPVHGDSGNETALKIWRSVFFLIGAGFSAAIGYLGMWSATRANVRVAAAAWTRTRPGDEGGVPHRRHRRNGHGGARPAGRLRRRAAVRG